MSRAALATLALPLLATEPTLAAPPPELSPDWVLTHQDAASIEAAHSMDGRHCCGYADGRPMPDTSVRWSVALQHYEVRYNRARWDAGTVSQTPAEPEPGDVWLEVRPGMLTTEYTPFSYTEAWVSRWQDWDGRTMAEHQELLCVTLRGGT